MYLYILNIYEYNTVFIYSSLDLNSHFDLYLFISSLISSVVYHSLMCKDHGIFHQILF